MGVQNISTFLKLKRRNWSNDVLSFRLSLREQQLLYSSSIACLTYCFLVNSVDSELEANNVTMCLWIGCICHWTILLFQIVIFKTLVPWSFGWSCVSNMIPTQPWRGVDCFLPTGIMLSAPEPSEVSRSFEYGIFHGGDGWNQNRSIPSMTAADLFRSSDTG